MLIYILVSKLHISELKRFPEACQRVTSKFTLAQCHLQGEKKFMIFHCVKSHGQSPFVQVVLSCDTAKYFSLGLPITSRVSYP